MANTMRLQKTKNDQYIVTIPKAFAEALGFRKGTLLEFVFNEKRELVLRKR